MSTLVSVERHRMATATDASNFTLTEHRQMPFTGSRNRFQPSSNRRHSPYDQFCLSVAAMRLGLHGQAE